MDDLHAPTVSSGPTSRPLANGTEKKQTLQELISRKENLEAELSALGSVLDSHGVSMNTSLTTFDGFPRSDIDVAQVRTTRARIIHLKNDYKAVMARLEVAVHEHFTTGKTSEAETVTLGSSQQISNNYLASTATSSAIIEAPFARVNAVTPNSPAAEAGLQVGDRVTRFGTINRTNHDRLGQVAVVVQQNENLTILVKVLRGASVDATSETVELRLTPRRDWGGRGLLGCHLLPL